MASPTLSDGDAMIKNFNANKIGMNDSLSLLTVVLLKKYMQMMQSQSSTATL